MLASLLIRPGKLDLLFHIVSHFLDLHVGGQSLFITICTQQIYGATHVKSGCAIAWKAIMRVEAAGLSVKVGADTKQI